MTEIQQYNPFTGEAIVPAPAANGPAPTAAVMSAVEWAQELDAYYQIAQRIGNTSFVPAHFRGKLEEQAMAMLYGKSLGMAPAIALRSIYSVHGTPALYAQQMYAIAIAHGHLIERVHATETGVKFRCKRKGSQNWQEVEWTIDRARKAKYTSNAKYQENPIGMLTEKCKAEAAKLVAADALAGMASVEEVELGDYDVVEVTEVQQDAPAPAAPKRTVRRKATPKAPAPEAPEFVEEAPAVAVDDEPQQTEEQAPEPSTRSQWIRLGNALDAVGITEKADKTEAMRSWAMDQGIDTEITSAKDLTSEQVEALIAELADDPDARAENTPTDEWPTTEEPQS